MFTKFALAENAVMRKHLREQREQQGEELHLRVSENREDLDRRLRGGVHLEDFFQDLEGRRRRFRALVVPARAPHPQRVAAAPAVRSFILGLNLRLQRGDFHHIRID